MQKRFQPVAVVVLACLSLAGLAVAQARNYSVGQARFLRLPPHGQQTSAPAGNLVQWNGSFTDNHGANRTFTMVGTDPTSTNTKTVIPVFIIPIKMVYGPSNGNM